MKNNSRLRLGILTSFMFVALLWCVKSAELLFHLDLGNFGVLPLHYKGLLGVFTAPLVHGSLEHLFNNTLPLLILGTALFFGYPKSWKRVVALVWIFSGLGVWLFAREANHIGASGLAHGLFFFIFVVSIFRRDKSSVALMMIAFLMYGGMTMTIFPREEGVSFEYHFFGALAGCISALLWRNRDPKPIEKTYAWEQESESDLEFMNDEWQNSEAEHDVDDSHKPRLH